MNTDLHYYLLQYESDPTFDADWGGSFHLRVTRYMVKALPPEPFISSVRDIILRDNEILVFTYHDRTEHIIRGGRREVGETIMETLEREPLEETGWTVADPRIFGLLHFHHLNARSPGYDYAYPDFSQPNFLTRVRKYYPDQRNHDDYVRKSRFVSLEWALSLKLLTGEAMFLQAILEGRR